MLFIPSNSKYKKQQKGKTINRVHKENNIFRLKFGSIALKSITSGRITSSEIKTIRQIVNKNIKKQGRLRLNIFSQTPITKKPLEIRMGKGKGNVNHWVCKIKAGAILLEIETEYVAVAIRTLKLVQIRISLNTKIIIN